MGYRSLRECVDDLERAGQLRRVREEVDPKLEAAEIQRRVFRAGGPALYYERVKGCAFPMASNLFGTKARVRHLFRDSLDAVRGLVDAKVDPSEIARSAGRALRLPGVALHLLPRPAGDGPVFARRVRVRDLPQLVSWPGDGGPFITLPQVYSEDPERPGVRHSNLGMYRVQLGGNDYVPDREVGLHYQIHRGLGVHHAAAIRRGEPLRVNVFVGGPPAMAVAAVMPLPEGLPEISFAGALNRRAIRMVRAGDGPAVHADADFCIRGRLNPSETKPEGPFGDHLGYYAKAHPFPVLHVDEVLCREDAIWPFTTVGRPPQEDTMFGELIHDLTAPLVPTVLPGVRAVHAVDAAGVHPLLLAVGSERYVPYAPERRPMEILTQANAILGQGQMSLAKYLFIVAGEDDPALDIHDVGAFLRHALARFDPTRDLHFQTNTTIDTLDYSGTGLNQGSKVVVAAAGPVRRELAREAPPGLRLPAGFSDPRVALPGVLVVRAPAFDASGASGAGAASGASGAGAASGAGGASGADATHGADGASVASAAAVASGARGADGPGGTRGAREAEGFCAALAPSGDALKGFPLIVLVDDSEFAARTLDNLIWVTFTRSDPARDVHGVGAFVEHKAWGCRGPVVIDARSKPHHAPPLVEDPDVTRRVDALFARGGSLYGLG